jgi:hypothetical protein
MSALPHPARSPDPAPSAVNARSARALVFALAAVSLVRFTLEVRTTYQHCCFDFPIFWDQMHAWLATGRLYPKADVLTEFLPGSATYKFPPFYASILALWLALGVDDGVYLLSSTLQVILYLVSIALLLTSLDARRPLQIALALILALNFGPFFETLWRLQPETWILALLAACLLLLGRGRETAAGAALGVAAMLKLYPAGLLAALAITRRWRGVVGFAIAAAIAVGIGLALFGWHENAVYFLRLVPFMAGETAVDDFASEGMGLPRYVGALLQLQPLAAKRVAQALVLAAALWTGWLAARERRRGPRGQALGFAAFVPLTLELVPNSWANYQVLLLIPLLVVLVPRWSSADLGPRILAGVAWALACCHQQMTDLGWIPGRGAAFECWQTLRGLAVPWLLWAACIWLLSHSRAVSTNGVAIE